MVETKSKDETLDAFLHSSDVLHDAVRRQHVNITKTLVQEYPSLTITRDKEKRTVLWHNKRQPEGERTFKQDRIRELVATQVISALQKTDEILNILADDGE